MIVRIPRRVKRPSPDRMVKILFVIVVIVALLMIIPLPGEYSLARHLLF